MRHGWRHRRNRVDGDNKRSRCCTGIARGIGRGSGQAVGAVTSAAVV